MSIQVLLNQMAIIMLLMALGYVLNKIGLMDQAFNKKLTKLILNVTLPCTILSSVFSQTGEREYGKVIQIFIIGILIYLLLPVLSYLLVKVFRLPVKDQGLYMFMTVYSNVGFMGFPVLQALYGPKAVFYAAIINIVFNASIYSMGIYLINYKSQNQVTISLKTLLSPGLLLSFVAIAIYFLNPPVPAPIVSFTGSVGAMTTPLAMMIAGAALGFVPLNQLFTDKKVLPYSLLRQIVLPFLFYPLVYFFVKDKFVADITFILLIMPIANTSVLYATLYNSDEQAAAKSVFFTTILSIVTIPLLLSIFHI